jgi:RNA polymerase sigma-70 factor (sigma-E family)
LARSPRDEEFSAFVTGRRVALLRTARLLTAGDAHLAEDLVQTALARMYVSWPKVRRSGSTEAYARRILVNAYIDEVRRPRWRREQPVADVPDQPDAGPAGGWPDAVDGEVVRAALAALPKRMRAAVVLRHWLDLSVEETAGLLNCSEGTVKSQTAKGIARLRGLLSSAPPACGPGSAPPGGGPVSGAPLTGRAGVMLPAEGN